MDRVSYETYDTDGVYDTMTESNSPTDKVNIARIAKAALVSWKIKFECNVCLSSLTCLCCLSRVS